MNIVILCEGISDAELLGQYMRNVNHYRLREKKTDGTLFDITSYEKPYRGRIKMYDNKNHHLAIWAGNGIWSIPKMLTEIAEGEQLDPGIEGKQVDAVSIVIDHDREEEVEDCLTLCARAHAMLKGIDVASARSEWIEVTYQTEFGNPGTLRLTVILMPPDHAGAIECFIMDALHDHDEKNGYLVDQVRSWLRQLHDRRECLPDGYLSKPRDIEKAPLGVYLAVAFPNRILESISKVLSSLDWSNFSLTKTVFSRLSDAGIRTGR